MYNNTPAANEQTHKTKTTESIFGMGLLQRAMYNRPQNEDKIRGIA